MSFQYHYHEVLDTIGDMFTEMFKGLRDNFAKEIEAVCQQYPMEPFKFLDPPLRLEYAEGVAMLKQAGNVWDSLFYVFDRKLHAVIFILTGLTSLIHTICIQKYNFWPKNVGEKWSKKIYIEIPPWLFLLLNL